MAGNQVSAIRKIGDVNGDGKEDFFVTHRTDPNFREVFSSGIQEFATPTHPWVSQTWSGPAWTGGIAFGPLDLNQAQRIADVVDVRFDATVFGELAEGTGDVNGDRLADLVFRTETPGARDPVVKVVAGRQVFPREMTEDKSWKTDVYKLSTGPRILDWDGDGTSEVLASSWPAELYTGGTNTNDFTLQSLWTGPEWEGPNSDGTSDRVNYYIIGDVNGDGRDDLGRWVTDDGDRITGLLIRYGGSLGSQVDSSLPNYVPVANGYPSSMRPLGDITGDGYDDFAVQGYLLGGSPFVQIISGAATSAEITSRQTYVSRPAYSLACAVGDLDSDGRKDLAIVESFSLDSGLGLSYSSSVRVIYDIGAVLTSGVDLTKAPRTLLIQSTP
jgi:hypothetical protein